MSSFLDKVVNTSLLSSFVVRGRTASKRKLDEDDDESKAQRPRESHELRVEVNLPSLPNSLQPVTLDFEAGHTIQLPTKWRFFMQPWKNNGFTYWGLFLRLHAENMPEEPLTLTESNQLFAQFSVKLLTPDPTILPKTGDGSEFDFKNLKPKGWKNFINVDELPLYKFENEKLRMILTFTMFGSNQSVNYSDTVYKVDDNDQPLAKKLKQFRDNSWNARFREVYQGVLEDLNNGQMTDLIIRTSDDNDVNAHRVIMAARSKYFKEKLQDLEQINGKFVYKVTQPLNIMKIVLCHIYSGSLAPELADPEKTDYQFAQAVAEAAKEYELKDLQNYLQDCRPDFFLQMQ